MSVVKRFSFVVCVLLATSCAATAQSPAPLYDKPVYDPDAKRYFALIKLRPPNGNPYYEGMSWGEADADARSKSYNGVQGRMAIVDSVKVHEFLLTTFHANVPAWIGLRYWCNRRQAEWSDGKFLQPGGFQAWDPVWNQDVYSCKSAAVIKGEQYMPVAYNSVSQGAFRWIGKGWTKHYLTYFIEFPTGAP